MGISGRYSWRVDSPSEVPVAPVEGGASPNESRPSWLKRADRDVVTQGLGEGDKEGLALSGAALQFANNGLDSLANLELRNYFKEETGIRITPSDISTANGLAEALYEYLTAEGDVGTPEPVKPVQIRLKKTQPDPTLATVKND